MNTKELAFKVREDIDNNIYSFGETIPSERELATRYEINRASVKTAIDTLVYEGYLYKIRGSGTYVIKNDNKNLQIKFKGLSDLLEQEGIHPSSRIIASEVKQAGYHVGKLLQIKESEMVFHLLRLRSGDNIPISLENTYIPYSLVKNIENYNFQLFSLYSILAAHNYQIDQIFQTISNTKVRNNEASLLDVDEGTSGISLCISAKTTTGLIVEYTTVTVLTEYASIYTKNFQKGLNTKIYAQID